MGKQWRYTRQRRGKKSRRHWRRKSKERLSRKGAYVEENKQELCGVGERMTRGKTNRKGSALLLLLWAQGELGVPFLWLTALFSNQGITLSGFPFFTFHVSALRKEWEITYPRLALCSSCFITVSIVRETAGLLEVSKNSLIKSTNKELPTDTVLFSRERLLLTPTTKTDPLIPESPAPSGSQDKEAMPDSSYKLERKNVANGVAMWLDMENLFYDPCYLLACSLH